MKNLLKHKKILFVVVGLLIVATSIVILSRPKADANEDILWREYPVSYGNITASLDGGGTLEATSVYHSFEVDLKVERVMVELGQEVQRGDTLVEYSKEVLQDQIEELELSLKAARRSLEEAQNNKTKALLENQLNQSQNDHERENTYQSSKREIENAIKNGEQKISQLQNKIAVLQEDLQKAQASEDGVAGSDQLNTLRAHLAQFQKELEQLQANNTADVNAGQISSLLQQRDEFSYQLDEIMRKIQSITDKSNQLKQLQQELSMVQQEKVVLQEQINGLSEDDNTLGDLQSKLYELQNRENELQEQINAIPDQTNELAGLQSQKNDLESQISSIDNQINELENVAANAAAVQQKQNQISNVQEQINALSSKEERIASLNEQLRQTQEELESVLFDLETQKIALTNLNNTCALQDSQDKDNQVTQRKIDDLTMESLNNAIENTQAEVNRIEKELATVYAFLDTPALYAKSDGVITEITYSAGDEAPGGKSVITIGDSGEKLVIVQVSQEDIGSVEVGQTVEMQFLANPDETLKGHVLEKSLVPSQGGDGVTYQVRIAFEAPQPELLQGMTCSVKFILKRVENVLTLANKAITLRDGKQFVTVLLPDGSHEEREIRTGFSDGRVSEIIDGLSDGDIVVIAG